MSTGLVIAIVGALLVALVVWIVLRAKKGTRERKERLAAFEQRHGLTGSLRTVDGGPRYSASGTIDGVAVNIDSELLHLSRGGMRNITRVRGRGAADLGTLVAMRRDVSDHDHGLSAALPEQTFGDQPFEDRYRTLAESAERAAALLTPELRQRMAAAKHNFTAFRSLKVAGPEVTVVISWSLSWGLSPETEALVSEALDVVLQMCRPG